jgi:hypothetical protein
VDEDGFESVVTGDERRFKEARNGDNIMMPFQCNLCHFRNIQRREPTLACAKDRRSLMFIRRANLNSLWAREPSTVAGNLAQVRRMEFVEMMSLAGDRWDRQWACFLWKIPLG